MEIQEYGSLFCLNLFLNGVVVLAEDLEKRQQEKKAEKMQKKQEQQEWEVQNAWNWCIVQRLNSRFESESKRHFRNRMKQEMQKELIKEVKKVKKMSVQSLQLDKVNLLMEKESQ